MTTLGFVGKIAKYFAWRFGSKGMRREIVATYVIAVGYTYMFSAGVNLPVNNFEWVMCAMLWPLAMIGATLDVYDYFAKT